MQALLPDRHPTKDFFVCDIFDALPGFRDDRASMEHPIFSLSTKPNTRTLHYEHNGNKVKIIPSILGLATIHDKDVLLYCISYLRAALKQGHKINQRIRLTAYDLLVSTNRPTNNLGYQRLEAALNRLRGTTINTNIRTSDTVITRGFGLIDSWEIIRTHPENGRMISLEIKLSDWFFNGLLADELLTINRDYFRLRKPLERRLYEIGRKHCGEKEEWGIGLTKLKLKTGSTSEDRKFKYLVNNIANDDREHKHFPDYGIYLHKETVIFRNRRSKQKETKDNIPPLPTWTYEKAREAAPRYDVYALEREWREWCRGKQKPDNGYPAAFVGFCRKKYKEGL